MDTSKKPSAQSGATLVEILVTMLVVAVGLLGAAGLQLASTRYQQTAQLRSQALIAAQFITEKIRANGSAISAALPATPFNAYLAADDYATASALPVDPACGLAAQPICTAQQAAQRDMLEWRRDMLPALPGGRGSIQTVAGGAFTDNAARLVIVMWQEKQQNEPGTAATPNPLAVTDNTCPPPRVAGVRCMTVMVAP
jgi:type IV pilus assembly protein PilV